MKEKCGTYIIDFDWLTSIVEHLSEFRTLAHTKRIAILFFLVFSIDNNSFVHLI